jgi:acyl carrier protein
MKITLDELLKIIAKSLNVKVSKIDIKTKDLDLEAWDSLGQLAILSSLDKKFKGKIKLDVIASATSIKTIVNFLKKKKLLK